MEDWLREKKKKIKDLVALSRLKEAISLTISTAQQLGGKRHNDAILMSMRLAEVENSMNIGRLEFEEWFKLKSQIAGGILNLVDDLDEESPG